MTITPTALLSLPLITTGTEPSLWGDEINNGLTAYLDIAVAGGLSVPITTADVTLSLTAGTSGVTGIGSTTAQFAILNVSGAKTAARSLILPSSSRKYVINNAGTSTGTGGPWALTVKGVATTGITLVDGEKALVAWNGTDYVKIANQNGIANFTGVGVGAALTPSTWSTGNAVEVGGAGSSLYGVSSTNLSVTSNAYYNAAWKYATSSLAARYDMVSGTHAWYIAPTGIVGATTTIYTGQTYTVTTTSSTTLGQWQAFFSALVGIPSVGQTILATASGTLLGGATVTQTLTFVQAMGVTTSGGITFGTSATAYGTAGQVLTSAGNAPPTWTDNGQIQSISASVATSALTLSASALSLSFRSTTLGSGTVTSVSGTPANLVVPSTATLGTVSAQKARLAVLVLNNAGTIELAVVNLSGGLNLDETTLISTTAISAAATSASTIYSTVARTSVAFRVVGYLDITEATAGTWATAPSTIQGAGGQALTRSSAVQSVVRLNTANGFGSTNTAIRRFTNTVTNQGTDITYADSAANGASFTINASGVYTMSYSDSFASGTGASGISLNSTQLTTGVQSINIADIVAYTSVTSANASQLVATALFLPAGSVIRPHTGTSNVGGTGITLFTISRVS